ncbi:Glycosyltransferases involved in cell wall biogenesis [Rhodococcus rhodochrous J45]|uniref:Glycosyltransferases involved in cell wall biogenesis n=1 Tax=Rhodococcus rhodochrous J45 TaxID=935266 RepID=A0A562EMK9_RHORH|nr:glycosyltransferase family A protein [Rhodococcus rhodochrous]TWH23069.1 Glycosyltransferases involved in cell wall biogenesis [Rhodococcus rhodochrous J45]
MEPTFSFLTTAYRTEDYVAETIESVLAQDRHDWEHVIVDNGMSDDMARVVGRYLSDPRIILLRQENRGYTGGVSAAAEVARGRYLCVLDSDDHLMPEFCTRTGSILESRPEVDAVAVDAHLFTDAEGLLPMGYMRSIGAGKHQRECDRLSLLDVLGGEVPYYTAAVRREAWRAVNAYASGIADVDESVIIWLRLADRFEVRLLPDRLARYRLRGDSDSRDEATVSTFERQLIRSFQIGAALATSPEEYAALSENVCKLRYNQCLRRARSAFLRNDIPAARSAARDAFSLRPSLRAAVALTSVTVAPGATRVLYPAKQRLSGAASRVAARLSTAN